MPNNMRPSHLLVICLISFAAADAGVSLSESVADILSSCPISGAEECARDKLLTSLGRGRSFEDGADPLATRLKEILAENQVVIELPDLFQRAAIVFRPGRGLDFDVEFPAENARASRSAYGQARDIMKHKMLLPLLMLVKLKLKALTPIMLAIVGLKAMKALVMSKIAIVLVLGFLIVQLCQKLGMAKMSMMPAMAAAAAPGPEPVPAPMYGAPPTTSSYDPSAWEPSPGGPYSRVYTTDSQQMAYSAYLPSNTKH